MGYLKALDHIDRFMSASGAGAEASKLLGNARIHLTIIQFVRLCGQLSRRPGEIYRCIQSAVNDPAIQASLPSYTVSAGNSRIIPELIRLKQVLLLILVCRYKAWLRYERRGSAPRIDRSAAPKGAPL